MEPYPPRALGPPTRSELGARKMRLGKSRTENLETPTDQLSESRVDKMRGGGRLES